MPLSRESSMVCHWYATNVHQYLRSAGFCGTFGVQRRRKKSLINENFTEDWKSVATDSLSLNVRLTTRKED